MAQLVEESSLGTRGARQLHARAPACIAAVIRTRAYFAGNDAGRAWWEANQHRPDELRRKAGELAEAGASDLSYALTRMADAEEGSTWAAW